MRASIACQTEYYVLFRVLSYEYLTEYSVIERVLNIYDVVIIIKYLSISQLRIIFISCRSLNHVTLG